MTTIPQTPGAKRAAPNGPKPRLGIVTGSRRALDLPSHILRQPAVPVDFEVVSRTERWDLVRGLLSALHAGPVGSGLAAPMAGVGLRVIVTTAGGAPVAMFNPAVVETAGPEAEAEEGNLSLPDVRAPVLRPHRVTVTWQTVGSGEQRTETFEDWHARVLMHEIEILNGRLFVDHASAPSLGQGRSDEERARRATARIFGETAAAPPAAERLSLALLPPSLQKLDGVLTRHAAEIDQERLPPDRLRPLIADMMRVLYAQRGVGLAAPQVGLGLRLIVIDSDDDPPMALINPVIVDRDEREALASEGCLSIPGWRGMVSRSTAVKVRADTIDGATTEIDLSGHMARIAQHEIDHLDGVLFTERMDPEAKLEIVDAECVADMLVSELVRSEARPRRSATQPSAGRPAAKRRSKRRR